MQRKVIVEEWLSLDGHVSDKTGSLDFFVKHVRESYAGPGGNDFLNSIDTILFGRHTYTSFSALWPQRPVENDLLSEKINTLDKIVFSNTLSDAPWGSRTEASIEKDLIARINTLKSLPGKNMVLWGSITVAQMLMKEKLVDEYRLHICPVITGGGRKLFADEVSFNSLTLLETRIYFNCVVLLRYDASTL